MEINTDCEGARSTVKGSKGNYSAILSGWLPDENVTIEKVKAHPEMWGKKDKWEIDEKGNWMADYVAGGNGEGVRSISAKQILKDIGKSARVVMVDKDGNPFVGDLRKRNSKYVMERYYAKRDRYRENYYQPACGRKHIGARHNICWAGISSLRIGRLC